MKTILTLLSLLAIGVCQSAQARRIMPLPTQPAFVGMWVDVKAPLERQRACATYQHENRLSPDDNTHILRIVDNTVVLNSKHESRSYELPRQYTQFTPTRIQGQLLPPYWGQGQSAPYPALDFDFRLKNSQHLLAHGFKPKHYYRCIWANDAILPANTR